MYENKYRTKICDFTVVPFAQIHIVVVIRIDSHTCSRGAVLRLQIA